MTQDTPGYRVLLVEDIGHGLAAVATRLEEALTLAWGEAFDLVILDLNLGGALTYRVWAEASPSNRWQTRILVGAS